MVCIHFAGSMFRPEEAGYWSDEAAISRKLDDYLRHTGVVQAYGSLACGADILIAEAVLRAGIGLHVFYSRSADAFIASSVACGGEAWEGRFRACLAGSSSQVIINASAASVDVYALTSDVAMAAATEAALQQSGRLRQLVVRVAELAPGSYTRRDRQAWQRSGRGCDELLLSAAGAVDWKTDNSPLSVVGLGDFTLQSELDKTWQALRSGLVEAVIFHAARTLEVLVRTIAESYRIDRDLGYDNLYGQLKFLEDSRQMPVAVVAAADLLRRLGNETRHSSAVAGDEDHWTALAALNSVLDWYLVGFAGGPQLLRAQYLLWRSDHEPLLGKLLPGGMTDVSELRALRGQYPLASLLAVVYAERLIDLRDFETALEIVGSIPRSSYLYKRANELKALVYSRRGEHQRAVVLLERGFIRDSDVESSGILGGACKREWEASGELRWLQKALRVYQRAWRSKPNVYSGINAAGCQLWLGRPDKASRIAGEVLAIIDKAHRYNPEHERGEWPFYTLASRAEALLLNGRMAEAAACEAEALQLGLRQGRPTEVFEAHMRRHREYLNLPA